MCIRDRPVTLSTKNLSVVPFLTAKSASTSTVLLNSLVPVTVRLPSIPAFKSTSRVSIWAVPSINRSFHWSVDVPRSLVLSWDGTIFVSTLPRKLTVSDVALPKSIFPLNIELPVTVRFPVIPAFSSTVSVSILAVPSMNKSCHSNVDVPKSLAPSVDGTKSLSNLPVAVSYTHLTLPTILLV